MAERRNGSDSEVVVVAAASSQSAAAYAELRRRIVVGELPAGTLVTEWGLVEATGFGKTPVREALARLVMDRLVTSVPRRGYVVTQLTLADVDELIELWRAIGPATVRLACERDPQEVIRTLKDEIRYVRIDIEAGRRIFERFADASGNSRLAEANRRLFQDLYRYLLVAYRSQVPKQWLAKDLRDMRDAMTKGEVEAAMRAYERSIDDGATELRELLGSLPSIRKASLTA